MAKYFNLICMADGVQSFAYLYFPQIVPFLSLTEPVSSAAQIWQYCVFNAMKLTFAEFSLFALKKTNICY